MTDDPTGDRVERLSAARRELLALWLADESIDTAAHVPYAAPETPQEQAIARVWQEVLEVGQVGVDDDYFALGGDSIHAIVIVARAAEAGLHLTAQDLFEQRTVRAVAQLAAPVDTSRPTRPDGDPEVALPLGPMQQGMLYHSVGGSSPGAYVVQVTCRLTGVLDRNAFQDAWRAVVAATPALRACFRLDSGQPLQVIVPECEVPIVYGDWRDVPAQEREARLERHLDADREREFALAEAPLMRLAVFRMDNDSYRCVWTHHHLVLDGWSQQLVLRDVFDCYDVLVRGESPQPPRRPAFDRYLRWLADRDPAADDEYWRARLSAPGTPTRIAGPGCQDGQVVAARRRTQTLRIPADRLRKFCRANGLTAGTVLTGGWALLLAALHDSDEVLFGVTVAGRPEGLDGATEMVGMFINTLPLRLGCPPDHDTTRWLADVQQAMTELRAHQHVPLSRVERQAGRGRAGLFDSIVVVENFPATVGDGAHAGRLRITDPAVHVDEGYPLVLEITPGESVSLCARYDPNRLRHAQVGAALLALETYVEAVRDETSAGVVRDRMHERFQQVVAEERRAGRERDEDGLRTARRRPEPLTGGQR